jgi:hypothetical protein
MPADPLPPNNNMSEASPTQTPASNTQKSVPQSPAKGNQYGTVFSFGSGKLFSCRYLFFKHDQAPLVMMTRIWPKTGHIAGINLHYLTFPYVKWMIEHYCGHGDFSWKSIKGDTYIANAFRCYKRAGLRLVRGIDCDFLKTVLNSLRSFDPEEIEAMRKEVNKQLQQRMNPKADELTGKDKRTGRQYTKNIYPDGSYDNNPNVPLKDTQSPNSIPAANTPNRGSIPGTSATVPGTPI